MASHVVFGASGGIGNAVVRELAHQGQEVRGVNTSGKAITPPGVEVVAADAARLDDVRRVVDGAEVVYQCLFPAVQDAIIEAVADTGATLVVANNLYMYDPAEGPMSEASAHAYGDREGGKFYAEMGEQALTAHREGRIKATVGQASDIYGPNVRHGIGRDQVFGRLMAGKPANVLGDPDTIHTYTYADDCARALITLGRDPRSLGQTWHVPSAEPITTRALLEMICDELGVATKVRAAKGLPLAVMALFSPTMRGLKREKVYQFTNPWLVDHGKYAQTFGTDITPHAEAVKQTVAWFKAHPNP